jgi:hypothetical protein
MLLTATIFLLYFFILLFILHKLGFVKNSGLSKKQISVLFFLKITTGIFATWYSLAASGDLLVNHINSLEQTAVLKTNPLQFFSSLFQSGYPSYNGFYSSHSFWNDLRYIFMDKILAVLNVCCFNNIYIDVLVYNTPVFISQVALYRVFISIWPQKKPAVIAGCFLLPGSMFFLSCINKDSMFFIALTMVMYALYKMPFLKKEFLRPKPLLLLITGLLLMFTIRNFFLTAVLPAVCGYYLCNIVKVKPWYIFAGFLAAMLTVIFSSGFIMQVISDRQNEFLSLGHTKSMVNVPVLKPGFENFIAYLPVCLNMVFVRPLLWQSYNLFYLLSSAEMIFYQFIFIGAIYFSIKNKIKITGNRLVLFGILSGLTAFIIIGYTIPYLGAVARYKSAFLPFLITPLLCLVPVKKFIPSFLKTNL